MNLLSLFLLLVISQDAPKLIVPGYPPPAEVRAAFLKLLDRPRVPLDPQKVLISPEDLPDGIGEESWTIAVERRADGEVERVPMLVVLPKEKGRHPAVILLHGTGGDRYSMRDEAIALAKRGLVAIAIDGRHHGARGSKGDKTGAYIAAITRAWKAKPDDPKTYPFYFDTCWDVWRTIDYLETRDDVDAKRIGLVGVSKGGIETWLAGAVDERVKAAVPCISVQSFRWSLDHDQWQGRANTIAGAHKAAASDRGESEVTRETCRALWNKVIPGMLDQFDCPSMLRLYAGRPLLIIGGDEDPNCPIGGAKVAIASAEAAYKSAGASDKLKVDIARGSGHTITTKQKAMILDWLAKTL